MEIRIMYKNKVTMNKETVKNIVAEFLSAGYFKQVDLTEEEKEHLVHFMVECVKHVIGKMVHPATERPEKGKHIIVVMESGNITSWFVSDDIMACFIHFNVKYWLYSNDIIPGKEDAV